MREQRISKTWSLQPKGGRRSPSPWDSGETQSGVACVAAQKELRVSEALTWGWGGGRGMTGKELPLGHHLEKTSLHRRAQLSQPHLGISSPRRTFLTTGWVGGSLPFTLRTSWTWVQACLPRWTDTSQAKGLGSLFHHPSLQGLVWCLTPSA